MKPRRLKFSPRRPEGSMLRNENENHIVFPHPNGNAKDVANSVVMAKLKRLNVALQ